jgi:hypothetical protein
MAEKFDEFLEEVEKDIRQEKLLNLWKQYGKHVIAAVIGVIVLIVVYNLWGQYDQNKRIQMAEKMISAQELIAKGETEKAKAILNSLSGSGSTYQQLGLFQKAGLLVQEGSAENIKEAVSLYNELSANTKVDPLWRDLATLLSVMISMDLPDRKAEELLNKLNTLTDDKNPWRYLAKEMKAVLLYQKGDAAQSMELFARLVQDNQTPPGISMRSRLMVQIVSTGPNTQ